MTFLSKKYFNPDTLPVILVGGGGGGGGGGGPPAAKATDILTDSEVAFGN